MARRKTNVVVLTKEERSRIARISKSGEMSAPMVRRCRILLELDTGEGRTPKTYDQIAASLGVSVPTICTVAKAFAQGGVEEVLTYHLNAKSADSIRKVGGREEAEIYRIACSPAPEGRVRWTLELIKDRVNQNLEIGISDETVRRVLKKGGFSLTG